MNTHDTIHELTRILKMFDVAGHPVIVQPLGCGNVNDTYLAICRTVFAEEQLVLQRINSNVFRSPENIMKNLRKLTAHVHPKLEYQMGAGDRIWQMPKIIPTRAGNDFIIDGAGNVWRVITKIASATAHDKVQDARHAEECGLVLGYFHWMVSDLDPATLIDPIPGFHITPGYLARYDATLTAPDAQARLAASPEAQRLAAFVDARRACVPLFQQAMERGDINLRVMHGDPKINNIMVDDYTGKGTAMIDLDTVGPGLFHFDFGDAVRSICNPAGEEETDLGKVMFDLDYFEAFSRGYMTYASGFLTPKERGYLFDAIRLITFELGLRFFQDHLAGNVYFKTSHPEQNLNRARVQFRLCESIEAHEPAIRKLLQ
ncbi:MAG: aminoglycoside phosphotransferase family protein [Kiritimatiellaeota bacterium]|nr:aminoglycoside phosphotransferase family protein [Kiritimatiellota bacterium]